MEEDKLNIEIKLNRPENLRLEELINAEQEYFLSTRKKDGGMNFHIKKGKYLIKQLPAYYFFIHVLLEHQYSKLKIERCIYDKRYVRIYSRDIMPLKSKNDFNTIWHQLVVLKVIEYKDDNRITQYGGNAKKAYYFKLSDNYMNSIIVEHEVLVNKKVAEKLANKFKNQIESERQKIININDKATQHQLKQLQNLAFDSASARVYIENLITENLIGYGRYNSCIVSINNIVNGRIKCSKSEVCNRIYSNVTGMPRELRQFILDGENKSMVEVDFGSFNAFAVYRIIKTMMPDFSSEVERQSYETELETYRNLLSRGDFYTEFKQLFFSEQQLSRDQIKNIVLKCWYNSKLNSRNKYRKNMQDKLPVISKIIDSLKIKNYKNFSHVTMKMESELVNELIYKRFIQLCPDAKLYSIFDSFLVEQKYAPLLKSIMQEEGDAYFDIKCIIKTKKSINHISEPEDSQLMQAITSDDIEVVKLSPHKKCKPESTCFMEIEDIEEILYAEDIPEAKIKPMWSENQIQGVFQRIYSRLLPKFESEEKSQLFELFCNELAKLHPEDKRILFTDINDLNDNEFWRQGILETQFLNLCNEIKQTI